MQDDPTPFASAPEPDPVQGAAPVTSAAPNGGQSRTVPRCRRTTLGLVAAIVFFDLVVVGAVWFCLTPKSGAATVASAPAAVEASLHSRVATDYPGYTVGRVLSFSRDDEHSPGGRSTSVQFTLLSVEHPGFQFTLVYYAPEKDAADVSKYTTDDELFKASPPQPQPQPQPVDSFIVMWMHNHPGEDCFGVLEATADSVDDVRTYRVTATRYEQTGATLKSVLEDYDFRYAAATGAWTEVPKSPELTDASGSLIDTAAAVAQALPGFEYVATEADSRDNPSIVVRSVKYPKLRVVVYAYLLDAGDPSDGIWKLFTGERAKSDAFARFFAARYDGNVVWDVTFDHEGIDDENLVDVWMEPSGDTVRLRYDPKTHVWTKGK